MRKYRTILLMLTIAIFTLAGCTSTQDDTLRIAAAASLRAPLEEIKRIYQMENSSQAIEIIYGGSGTLTQQISNGAPMDLFLSASEDYMKVLLEKQIIDAASVTVFAQNQLVVAKPIGSPISLENLSDLGKLSIQKIAIGEPSIVPAGKYAKESLVQLELWALLEPKLIYAKDVTQVLAYVESGNADIGFIYKSDIVNSEKAESVYHIPEKLHEPIRYLAGRVRSSKKPDASERFLHFLQSEKAQDILKKFEFTIIE